MRVHRRFFLLLGLLANPASAAVLDVSTLTKYLDPLPLPSVIAPSGTLDGAPLYEVSINQFQQQLHSQIPPTTLWGYEGSYPGPTFEVQRDQTIKIRWTNDLRDTQNAPLDHILPYDNTIHGAGAQFPQARTIAHVHGAVTDEASDGFPEHWFSPDAGAAANGMGGPAGNSLVTTYTNNQRAAANWYHDHSMGITRLNVYAGMAGLYNIRDAEEQSLGLPSGDYEIPLVIQDRSFNQDGSLFYPDGLNGVGAGFPGDASQVARYLADANLVNGKVWPYLEVEPRKYRFRMLNGANTRFYDLELEPQPGAANANPLVFNQIGTDSGLLAATSQRNNLALSPADRADVIVDFSSFNVGDRILLRNNDPEAAAGTTDEVMEFRIKAPTAPDVSTLPTLLSTFDRYDENDAVRTRTLRLTKSTDQYGRAEFLLDDKKWIDPNSETIVKGEMEIWEFVNETGMAHPMHLHMDAFQVLDREDRFGADVPLADFELGFEDTVTVGPHETVRIMVRFDQYTGTFVWHCHILEHEDSEMMRTFRIVSPGDYDQDGDVDPDDYALWRDTYGSTGIDLAADGNNDGMVDAADYTIWRDNVSAGAVAPPANASAPEPASLLLGACGVLLVLRRQNR
ncbi:MAG: multicopper oxidase domain-containing protein [Planctomycetales bacterium]|nr:multicopper oxidase domain-containing protein [Planctomycetales bacterium]